MEENNVVGVGNVTIATITTRKTTPIKASLKLLKQFTNKFTIKNNVAALVVLCLCVLMQNMIVGGANNAILTTIERAYYMTSIESAVFLTLYDVTNIFASPVIGYFGDKLHKPTVIGISMIGLSIASLVTVIPEFLVIDEKDSILIDDSINGLNSSNILDNSSFYSKNNLCYPYDSLSTSTTTASEFKSTCGNSFLNNLKYIFFLANMINGVASVSLYTTAISYIENIFSSKKAPLCQGIYYAVGALGVGIGMLLTGNMLNINGSSKKSLKKIDSNNVNWIGAWWIIYAINAIASFILGFLVMRFSEKLSFKKLKPKTTTATDNEKNGFRYHLQQFKASGLAIISNKCFVFIVICTTCETLLIKGYSSYLTKYLEYQYRLPASTATMLTGGIGFISLIGGTLIGAFLIKKFKWGIKQCTKFITFILFITSACFLGLIIHCPQEEFIGSNHVYTQLITNDNVTCKCDPNVFNPLCYKTDYLFLSPCHAGCTVKNGDSSYSDCKLLNRLTNYKELDLHACSRPATHCITRLIVVSAFGLLVLFLSSIIIMPILKIVLECVDVESQSFALGIRSLFTKLFGNIPGPLIFASVVDKSCIHWITRSCTGNKTCRLYNNKMFSQGLSILGSSFRMLSAIFALITLIFVNKSGLYETKSVSPEPNNSSDSPSAATQQENISVITRI